MTKVITYGTFDLLHHGHIRLLERAKELGDYLIVGVTADDFDKTRGKINVRQSMMERVEAVRSTGLADEIIIEEYEGQKIDDIKRYDIDIFTVGSDWIGQFDYLREFCRVVYLDRTQGVSSTELRAQKHALRLGLVGESQLLIKYKNESEYVNGIEVSGIYTTDRRLLDLLGEATIPSVDAYDALLTDSDAVYIASHPSKHYRQVKEALMKGKHVMCESPVALDPNECTELFALAREKQVILMESLKTAYSTAYNRLLLLVKSGKIGQVVSVDATCTSLRDIDEDGNTDYDRVWNSICAWGPTAMLPIFQILGTQYLQKHTVSWIVDEESRFDSFSKIDFIYPHAVASLKVGKGVKSEGELTVSGTKGYIYVPAPWWKTDYFEIRYEDPGQNKRYFYQLDGEGIRYEILAFIKSIEKAKPDTYIGESVSVQISEVIGDFYSGKDVTTLSVN